MSPSPVLAADSLTRRYGDLTAVDDFSLTIERGELVGLLGPNGAGKTTLLSMIAGLQLPDTGTVAVDGSLGYCPQHLCFWPDLTPTEQLSFLARMYTKSDARIDGLLGDLGLADKAHTRASALSGGMQRRLNIALALVHDPPFLILDEPTVGLDPVQRRNVHEWLTGLDKTILLSTHDIDEADKLSTRVVVMHEGKLVKSDTPGALKQLGTPREATLEDAFLALTGREFE